MLNRKLIITADGSSSLQIEDWNETYHSKHGAIQEAEYIFIQEGFQKIISEAFNILEIGFGTGLNAFLTILEAEKSKKNIHYTTLEKYPLQDEEWNQLNYKSLIAKNEEENHLFELIYNAKWGDFEKISSFFTIRKLAIDFFDLPSEPNHQYDLVYFDAFSYDHQPHLWSEEMFQLLYNQMKTNSILITYAARGVIKRAMESAGFTVEKLAGPPGKRHILRAYKL